MLNRQQSGLMANGYSGGNDTVNYNVNGGDVWQYNPMSDISNMNSIGDILNSYKKTFAAVKPSGGSFGSSVESDQLSDREFGKFMSYMQGILGQRSMENNYRLQQYQLEEKRRRDLQEERYRRKMMGRWASEKAHAKSAPANIMDMGGAKGIELGSTGAFRDDYMDELMDQMKQYNQNFNNWKNSQNQPSSSQLSNAGNAGVNASASIGRSSAAGNWGDSLHNNAHSSLVDELSSIADTASYDLYDGWRNAFWADRYKGPKIYRNNSYPTHNA